MKNILLVAVVLLFMGCATSSRQTDSIVQGKHSLPLKAKINVPFVKQPKNQCGPAAMAMVMRQAGKNISLLELASQMFTPLKDGSFQTDLVVTARRQGMIVVPVKDLKDMLIEISNDRPVLVFQNLGMSWWPKWHYAVALGYDLNGPQMILHSGPDKFLKTDMRIFERSWALGDYWAIVVLPPDQLASTATELDHGAAAAALEHFDKFKEAEVAYKTILSKWPQSLIALMGLGNLRYKEQRYKEAVKFLERASLYHSNSSMVWHNLAIALGSSGFVKKARRSAEKALELVEKNLSTHYQKNLAEWLPQ